MIERVVGVISSGDHTWAPMQVHTQTSFPRTVNINCHPIECVLMPDGLLSHIVLSNNQTQHARNQRGAQMQTMQHNTCHHIDNKYKGCECEHHAEDLTHSEQCTWPFSGELPTIKGYMNFRAIRLYTINFPGFWHAHASPNSTLGTSHSSQHNASNVRTNLSPQSCGPFMSGVDHTTRIRDARRYRYSIEHHRSNEWMQLFSHPVRSLWVCVCVFIQNTQPLYVWS